MNPETIPTTLDEAVTLLAAQSTREDRDYFLSQTDASFHFTTGMAIRNAWGLWDKESPLYKHFAAMGIYHADDMSGIIFAAFRAHLKNETLDLAAQVKRYQDYWNKTREYTD